LADKRGRGRMMRDWSEMEERARSVVRPCRCGAAAEFLTDLTVLPRSRVAVAFAGDLA
jgi:hypothetical protein